MKHPNDGVLRRMLDEPLAAAAAVREHLADCPTCRQRMDEIQRDAAFAAQALGAPQASVESSQALGRVWSRLEQQTSPAGRPIWRGSNEEWRRWAAGATAAAGVAALLGLTPIGSYAKGMLTIFKPTSFVAVKVPEGSLKNLGELAGLSQYGALKGTHDFKLLPSPSAQAVAQATGLQPPQIGQLPAGLSSTPSYQYAKKGTGSFTLNGARMAAAAKAAGRTLPPLPKAIDGSTLFVRRGPVIVMTYQSAAASKGAEAPALLVAKTPLPVVSSSGATVQQIDDYLLSLPGVSPQLRAAIEAIGSPAATLPIPIPPNATAHAVTVHGAKGLLVAAPSGIASGVIWQRSGMLYGVVGSLSQQQILQVAQSVH